MNRRNGNWLALSINQLTAPAVTGLAAFSGYRSIKPAALHPTRRLAGKASRQSLPAVTELRGAGAMAVTSRSSARPLCPRHPNWAESYTRTTFRDIRGVMFWVLLDRRPFLGGRAEDICSC